MVRDFTFFDTSNSRLLGMRRNRSIVGRGILWCPATVVSCQRSKSIAYNKMFEKLVVQRRDTYGATGKSAFLFLMGSDILTVLFRGEGVTRRWFGRGVWRRELRKNLIRFARSGIILAWWDPLAPLGRGAWRDGGRWLLRTFQKLPTIQ